MADDTLSTMSRTVKSMDHFLLDQLQEHHIEGLSTSHGDILMALFLHDELTMNELAQHISRDPSTVTFLVHKLKNRGYVEIHRGVRDGRSNVVTLTDKGHALRPVFDEISEQLARRQNRGLSAAELESFHGTLERIQANFEEGE